jgi:hypothetical protein
MAMGQLMYASYRSPEFAVEHSNRAQLVWTAAVIVGYPKSCNVHPVGTLSLVVQKVSTQGRPPT